MFQSQCFSGGFAISSVSAYQSLSGQPWNTKHFILRPTHPLNPALHNGIQNIWNIWLVLQNSCILLQKGWKISPRSGSKFLQQQLHFWCQHNFDKCPHFPENASKEIIITAAVSSFAKWFIQKQKSIKRMALHAKAISADIANYDLVSALRGLSIADDNVDGKFCSFGASNKID